ncbi:diphthamide biosynthesis enzyme Dph2 [Candidatus Bathyarchaeota archaeon]|nr:diphthamide biosynthesis enzyme Dph2 [Candidatus Bathyarchaeota archaeon]
MNSPYNLEIDRLINEITRRRAKRVLIQAPDGIKPQAASLSRIVETRTSAEAFLSASACYGACDIDVGVAAQLHADLIIHYGHTEYIRTDKIPVVFLEARSKQDLTGLLSRVEFKASHWRRVGLAATLQHLDTLKTLRGALARQGVQAVIAPRGGRNTYDGQIIGCDYTPLKTMAGEVEAFLVLGSRFHGLGASLAVEKPVLLADPSSGRVTDMSRERERIILRRYAAIELAKEAENFGIILGTKPGQHNPAAAAEIKRQIICRGRTACTIIADEVTPELLLDFEGVQAFVNTACPRLSLDDAERFAKPILSPNEALAAVGGIDWEDILEKGLL